ncbi:MAG TPA: hypothetical protein VIS48_02475 [Candidatus Kryptonia bacterium]
MKFGKCPDCLATARLQSDYPSSFLTSFLKSIGLIRIKRCSNCNAEVFVVIGLFTTSRKRFKVIGNRIFWSAFILWLLIVGYVVIEAMVK